MKTTFQEELIKHMKSYGSNVAIESPGRNISYNSLLSTCDKITDFLLKMNLASETIIGIQLNKRVDLISAIIGVMNARCIFTLIDASLPVNRIGEMMRDLNMKYIITSRDSFLIDIYASNSLLHDFFIEDILESEGSIYSVSVQYPTFNTDDSIYIYFTSGSTGHPKGIVGKNSSLLQFLQWEIDTFAINNQTRVSQFISPYFDAFLRDIFIPLMAGGTICLPPSDQDFFTTDKMSDWIDKAEINLIHCVPSVFRIIKSRPFSLDCFKYLKYILLSGEKILPSELKNWYKIFSDRIQLVNLYGTTETTMIQSYYLISPEDVNLDKIPIGSPLPGTEILITKDEINSCSSLVPGEIYIISDFTSKGYLNAPELTHSKFLKWNTSHARKTIAFKTGDRARILTDGTKVLLGRQDRQVKLRGIRIELDEIENILVRFRWIRNVAVIKHEKENGNESIIAFVILNLSSKKETEVINEIHLYLENSLPAYMIPNITVVIEYPLLANGKINYKELSNNFNDSTLISPADAVETRIMAIWRDILGIGPVSTMVSFHKAGGDSLTMMALIGGIYREFNVRITLNELFTHPTIQQQAAFIKQLDYDDLLLISKAAFKDGYDLTAAQKRIYFNYDLNPLSTAFNLPMAFEIKRWYNKERIKDSMQEIIDRHESLRTSFFFKNGKLVQEVIDVTFILEEIKSETTDCKDVIASFIRPFQLDKAPLIRAGIIVNPDGRRILIVDIHHIVCDGQSQMNLYKDFLKLYRGGTLLPLELQYKDYAEWENNFRTSPAYIASREFWLKEFEDEVPKLNLPMINSETAQDIHKGGNVSFSINSSLLEPIMELFKKDAITSFTSLFSILFLFLSRITGQDDIVIGVASAGRMQPEIKSLVGMFVKTLPIRFKMDTNMSFIHFVKAINKHFIQASSNQVYDLSDIVQELNARTSTPVSGLSDVMFVFLNFKDISEPSDTPEFIPIQIEHNTSKNALTLYASENDHFFHFRFEYSSMYFSRSNIDLLVSIFIQLVKEISENPASKISNYMSTTGNYSHLFKEDDIVFNF